MGPELPKGIKSCNLRIRDVAQPGRAQRSGRWGRRFKSCRPDFVFEDPKFAWCPYRFNFCYIYKKYQKRILILTL